MIPHGRGTDRTTNFHAHHAPVGALATYTCGKHHHDTGAGHESGQAPPHGLFAGYRDGTGADAILNLFPFFPVKPDDLARYIGSAESAATAQAGAIPRRLFDDRELRREVGWCSERWLAGDAELAIFTPLNELPDPACAPAAAQRDAFIPATTLRFTVSNPGTRAREMLFAATYHPGWRMLNGINGLANRRGYGFATDQAEAQRFTAFSPEWEYTRAHGGAAFGGVAGFRLVVPPGQTRTMTIAVGWWHEGIVTFGKRMAYWYTRLFGSIEDVLGHALARADAVVAACAARDAELMAAKLDDEQRFLIAHSTRGYFASTQLLDDGGTPRWIVNEGEYLTLNTLDLTVDMAFFEARFQPWALRNVLDQFAAEYRYSSRVYDPAEPARLLPGGVAFTHDMGGNNTFSPDGHSVYETAGIDRGCFSYMSCEELTNWILSAGIYWRQARDAAFLAHHAALLVACQSSLLNRDHPDAAKRRGYMQCEDERCAGGGEITTYDSLDHSLGQARANGYLAGKMWACHLVLAELFAASGRDDLLPAGREAAARCAAAITASADAATGIMPSILTDPASAPIIPVIEALAYPAWMGLRKAVSPAGPYGAMVTALRRHLLAVLKPGLCLYPDGGWKLSASADNSWASKIHLCQWVAERVLDVAVDPRSHRVHADWQRTGAASAGVSDQFRSGVCHASAYYPRIVTTILWLNQGR
ncbi:MAG: beta-xylosidase [Hyphomicrobiales bacterium]|nr:MAG: beta-xylosidase [Hyphomicrobiales bacterium]